VGCTNPHRHGPECVRNVKELLKRGTPATARGIQLALDHRKRKEGNIGRRKKKKKKKKKREKPEKTPILEIKGKTDVRSKRTNRWLLKRLEVTRCAVELQEANNWGG